MNKSTMKSNNKLPKRIELDLMGFVSKYRNMLLHISLFFFLIFQVSFLTAKETVLKKVSDDDKAIREILNQYEHKLYFTENNGQWDNNVLFKVDFKYGQAIATSDGMLVGAYEAESLTKIYDRADKEEDAMHRGKPFNEPKVSLKGHNWLMNFVNSSPEMKIETNGKHDDTYNYFMERDPSKFANKVSNFQEIWYKNVYKNVDVRYYPSENGELEYDIICKPGFNHQDISLRYDGIENLNITKEGKLILNTSIGDISFPKPYVYQSINGNKKQIEASYIKTNDNSFRFELGDYDKSLPLIIDPIALRSATWLTNNSAGDNHGHGVWVDETDGAIYTLARIIGSGLITTVGAYQTSSAGNLDIVLGKYLEPVAVNQPGTRVWQTYLGGSGDDNPYAIEMGPDGNLYITGYTSSTNFPLIGGTAFVGTGSSLDNRTQTSTNIFITKINKAGNSIKSAVIGGNGSTEESYDLRTTPSGDIIVCGHTTSTNLATLYPGSGASNTNNGGTDILIFKINQNLTAISWMKNFGGSGNDRANIMLNNPTNGDIFVAGQTSSINFPALNARQTSRGGTQAGFIQKLNSSGTTLWSSYFSSASNQTATILCMEFNTTKTKLYFGGMTSGLNSANISSSGVYDNSQNGGNDFFICRMDTSQLFNMATYLGGTSSEDNMMGLNTDANNDVYIFGYTPSTNFPITTGALQTTNLGSSDKTFSKLNSDLSSLLFSTYYGGSSNDYDPVGERGIKFANCRIYTLVTAQSNNIPLTQNALTTTKLSSTSIYEPGLVIWANPPDLLGNTITPSQNICYGSVPGNLTGSVPSYSLPNITRNGTISSYPTISTPITYQWQISTDSINWNNISSAAGQNLSGSVIGQVFQNTFIRRIISGDACVISGASDQIISLKIIDISGTVTNVNCSAYNTGTINITVTNGTPSYSYLWSDGATTQNRIGLSAGTYSVTVTDAQGCTATKSFTLINVNIKPEITAAASPVTICKGESSQLNFSPTSATSVIGWFNGCSASGSNLGTGNTLTVSPIVTSSYSIVVESSVGCRDTACVTVSVETSPPIITCPPSLTLNNNESTSPTNTGFATAIDNSTPQANIIITFVDINNIDACIGSGILTRKWYAIDECGNKDSCIQTITLRDSIKPISIGRLPSDTLVNCDAVPVAATITAVDNCGNAVVTLVETRTNGNCTNNYILRRTWTATDACGNTQVYTQTVTVQDTTKPVITGPLPANVTVNCNAVPTAPTLTATDNCGIATVTYNESRANGNCTNNYILTRTWTVTDACNNSSQHIQTVTVQDTTKPVITGPLPANVTVNCDAIPTAPTLTATDNCGNATVTYNESRANGNCTNNYVLTRTWTATDVCNNSSQHIQILTLQDTTKPIITGPLPANVIVNCDAVPTAPTLTATDNCGSATITYNESRANGNCTNKYVLTRIWTATDVCNNSFQHIQTVIVQDTTKPVISGPLPANVTVNCNAVPTAPTLTATDNCGNATVTYNESRANGNCTNNYVLTRTWTATDVCNNSTQHIQTVIVQDTTKPVINGPLPANVTVNCNAVPTAPTLTATDNCGNATVTYNESRANGNCTNNYVLTRTWTATDVCNNSSQHNQIITVQDTTKPIFDGPLPQNITVNCDNIPNPATLTATDNCGSATVTYSESTTQGGCTGNGGIIRTWTATDACNNKSVYTQMVTVQDTTKPVITGPLPANVTVNCDAVPTAPTLTATDNCGNATVTYNESRANGNCTNNYILTRTWTATDACNNSSQHIQILTLQDTTKPVITGPLPANVTVNCDAVPTAATLTATDNCGNATITYNESRANGNCTNNYVLTRTWTATDLCNNSSQHIQTVTVQDTTKPVITGPLPSNVTVNCDAVPTAATLTATDNCGNATITYNESRANGNCTNNYVLTRTWTATDVCNNRSQHIQTVTVQDTTKPIITRPLPSNVIVNCDAVPTAPTLTATDNCGNATVTYNESRTNGNCINNYVLTRTWTATDLCNNSSQHIQTVTVQDTTKPVFDGPLPQNITVNCDNIPNPAILTATDNCGSATVTYRDSTSQGGCTGNGGIIRIWTATDACNNTTVYTQIVTVQDTTKPVINGPLPGNITVNCNAIPMADTLTATDNCGSVTVIFNEDRADGNCANSFVLIRTWTATDACSNFSSYQQIVSVQDTTKPVFDGLLPLDIIVNCDDVPNPTILTASDNCGSGSAGVTFSESRIDGNCANNYVLTRIWTATDSCNNSTTYVQTVTVQDTTKPIFDGPLPDDIIVDCDIVPTAQTLTATDNCSGAVVTFNERRVNGNCTNNYVLTRTWTATDSCNNSTIYVQTITVQDTTKPVFDGPLPDDITVDCDNVPTAPTLIATDNCGVAVVTFNENRIDGNCSNSYILKRTWIVTDLCNNTSSYLQTVTVQDTTNPVFNGPLPEDITVDCDNIIDPATLTATDNCGGAVVTFNESRANGNCTNNYVLTRTWTATDSCNNSTIYVQTVTVQDTTRPVFDGPLPGNIIVNCDNIPNPAILTATDNCGGASVTYSESTSQGGCTGNGGIIRTWTATDACNNTTVYSQTVTVQDTTKPVINGPLPGDITVNCDAIPLADTLTATDNCGSATVTFNEDRVDGNCINSYVLTRTWTAKDACDNTNMHQQIITVQDTTKPMFVEQLPLDITVNCDVVPLADNLTATDNCGIATVTFNENRIDGNCTNSYVLTRTWTAKDACDNTTMHQQIITVQDTTKPIFVEQLPSDIRVNCDEVPLADTLTATDNCGSATFTYNERRIDGNCINNYTLTRTWTAKDECNNITIYQQTITVQDGSNPEFIEILPQDITVNCDAVPTADILTARDNCGSVIVTFNERRINGNCINNYALIRTWTAKDICENTTSHVQTITVQDTTKPTFVGQLPANMVVCREVPQAAILSATDNCDGRVSVVFTETIDSVTTNGVIIYTRTWTATDLCFNTTVHIQTIRVNKELHISIDSTICEGEQIVIGNNSYGLSGTYTTIFSSALGCDSIITLNLTVNPVKYVNIDAVICQGEQIVIGNTIYTTSVTNEMIVLQSSKGCDSIITFNLIVLNSDTIITNRTICQGDRVEIGGQIFTTSGTYFIPFQNNQCSGVVKLILNVLQPTTSTINKLICEDEVITVGGQVFTMDGTYTVIIPNADGCDSIITLILKVIPKTSSRITKIICLGESFTVGTQIFYYSGTYNIPLTNTAGCDSNVTLNLIVLNAGDTSVIYRSICEGEFTTVNEQSFDEEGVYYIVVSNNICSSIVELNLTVNPISNTTLDKFICTGEAIVVGNQTFTETGTYTIMLQNSTGCDSIITLNLNVSPGGDKTQIDTILCFGQTLVIAGQSLSSTGTYQIIYPADVCRDTLLINLTVNPVSASSIDTSIFDCQGGITIGGEVYIEPGTYQISLQNSFGCDSIVTLNLRVRLCDTIPIGQDTTIYDTLPVLTTISICELSLPPGNTVVITNCNGQTSGTLPHGTWTINTQTNCLEYTAGDVVGNDTLCITACNPNTRQCNTTTVIITVIGLPPIANDDCVEEIENNKETIINVLQNDTDPDNDQLIVQSIVVQPKHGSVTISQNGQSISYTPNRNFCGRDTLYYEVCDREDGCDTAMVCLHINCKCIFPQVITPNNDGFNDYLFFPCINGIDGVRLLVWHRWGLIVYEDNNYKNDWQGTLKGELLPAGTYWYSIEYTDPETKEFVKEVNYFMIIN